MSTMKSKLPINQLNELLAPYDEDGPYDPKARQKVLKILKENGWTEKEYLSACDNDE